MHAASDQRHHRYVDARMQLRVMVALVGLEILLVAGTLWLLHGQLAAAIEANLYSVHFDAEGATFPMLARVALPVLGGFAVVHLLAVVLAAQVWGQQVAHVMSAFRTRLARVEALDLRPRPVRGEPAHPVLAHAARWQSRERARLADLQRLTASLDADMNRERLRAALARTRPLLAGDPPGD